MGFSFKATLHPDVDAALRGLKPEAQRAAIASGMTTGAEIIAGLITEERLTGKGPFPVEQNRLGVDTGRLRQSVRATPARIEGEAVIVSIGSNVEYAAVHEFGFEGDVQVPEHERLGHKVRAHSRHITIPERAPFRTGIREHLDELGYSIFEELQTTFRG